MRSIIFLVALVSFFSAAKADYLVQTIYKDRFMGKEQVVHVLDFKSVSTNGYDRDCEGGCVMWVFDNTVRIMGSNLIIGHTSDRNKDIQMRMRFGDEVLPMTCKLTDNAKNCAPVSKSLSESLLAKKIRNFVGGFALEFVQELPGANRYRRDVWAANIEGIAPIKNSTLESKKTPGILDDVDYTGLHQKPLPTK